MGLVANGFQNACSNERVGMDSPMAETPMPNLVEFVT